MTCRPSGNANETNDRMTDYRAYIVSPDGHFQTFEAIDAADDDTALRAAEKLRQPYRRGFWQLDRKIAVLPKDSLEATEPMTSRFV